jgi:uncharacterized membrane protein
MQAGMSAAQPEENWPMNFEPLLDASPAIQLHALAAVLAFLLGGMVLFRRKGDRLHRMGGRIWVALMLVVAFSSFFIHTIRMFGPWSPIHLLSILTLVAIYRGVSLARAQRIFEHRRTMQATYVGALVIAGFFTFMPGRIMYEVFFEGPQPLAGVGAAAAIVISGTLAAWKGMKVPRPTGRRAGRLAAPLPPV